MIRGAAPFRVGQWLPVYALAARTGDRLAWGNMGAYSRSGGRRYRSRMREQAGRRSIARQLFWAAVPLWSLGMLSFGPFLWLAVTRRRRSDIVATVVYAAAVATALVLVSVQTATNSHPASAAAGGLLVALMFAGAGHSLVAFRPSRSEVPQDAIRTMADRNVSAISGAKDRINARGEARKLTQKDPELARELRIGRPDLARDYDDGGLVDMNHVPATVLVSHLGLSVEQAAKVVTVRSEINRFDGPSDLEEYAGLPPERVDELSELMIFG
jgi:hypothetical protein